MPDLSCVLRTGLEEVSDLHQVPRPRLEEVFSSYEVHDLHSVSRPGLGVLAVCEVSRLSSALRLGVEVAIGFCELIDLPSGLKSETEEVLVAVRCLTYLMYRDLDLRWSLVYVRCLVYPLH